MLNIYISTFCNLVAFYLINQGHLVPGAEVKVCCFELLQPRTFDARVYEMIMLLKLPFIFYV